jgi:LemA protein
MGMVFVILVAIVGGMGLLALFAVGQYNTLVTLRNRYKNDFSQIDVQLKRRYDLILNLVKAAKNYLEHDSGTLAMVVSARNSAYAVGAKAAANPGHPPTIKELIRAEARLSGALGRFFAVVEADPDLKADRNLAQLSEELTFTENKISFARHAYNDGVMAYNARREVFPANIIARMFSFGAVEFFEVEDVAEKFAATLSLT